MSLLSMKCLISLILLPSSLQLKSAGTVGLCFCLMINILNDGVESVVLCLTKN